MKKNTLLSLLVLLAAFLPGIGQAAGGINYAISLPGGPDAATNNGAYSNIDISGVPLTSTPYTMEMWVYINTRQVQYAGLIYHRHDASINSGVQFAANWQMNNTPNAIRTNNNTSGYGLLSDTLTLNAWHHLAIVVTAENRTCYIDGKRTTENVVIPDYDFSTGHMWIGRDSANDVNDNRAFKGLIDEVRIWNVAKSAQELEDAKYLTLTGEETGLIGYWNFDDSATVATDLSPVANHGIITGGTYVRATPLALKNAIANLSLAGNLSEVISDLTLPTTADGDVTITWSSSNANAVDNTGKVTRPTQYDATVRLTATLSVVDGGQTHSLTKVFTVIVKAFNEAGWQVAKWDFTSENIQLDNGVIKVKDASDNAYVATLKNEASIRTIGVSDPFNVLDLGDGTGYMDLDTLIGQAMYAFNNYTVCGFFRIAPDYSALNSDGNYLWTFSNSANVASEKNGFIGTDLKAIAHTVSRIDNTLGKQTVSVGSNAPVGDWHHLAYTQKGTTGTLYLDGIQVATGTVTNLPVDLALEGRTGTRYNWLGRSPFTNQAYLRKTLVYNFQLWRDALTEDDLNYELEIASTVERLNNAFAEDSSYILPELVTERDALTLGDLSAITQDLTLPTQGTDPAVSIFWKSDLEAALTATGTVTRPETFPATVKLTATLFKDGQSVTKDFIATVLPLEGTAFTNDLMVKFDFSDVDGNSVKDVAEMHYSGTLVNGAAIRLIGTSTIYPTLDLYDSTAYFNMGAKMGSILYNLNDYTMSCYYRIDSANTWIGNAGNFLWSFSNSDKTGTDQNGVLFGGLRSQSVVISPKYWSTGEQGISAGAAAQTGGWHHMAYTQQDTIANLYVDGMLVNTDTITWLPANTLRQPGQLGTLYNWLGRSPYVGDAYLSKALLHDFRLYRKALTEEEIQLTELNVVTMLNNLDAAYLENPNPPVAVRNPMNTAIKVYGTPNGIRINGLTGVERVAVFDLSGRSIRVANASDITLKPGLYFVKVDTLVTKVLVR